MDMNVALKITAGVSGQQAVDQLRTSMQKLGDGANDVAGRFGVMKGALAALAGSAVVAGFVAMMRSIIETADKLNDLSQKTGIAVADLDALGYAAELNGTNLDQVSGAISKLARNMGEAAGGSKEAIAVFRQFGISQAEIKNGSITATDALARIADRISQMPDGLQKAAAAQAVFGKSAADIVPLLNAGGRAIREARAELEAMGALMDQSLASAADEFNDNMTRLRRSATAFGLGIAREVLPVLDGFVRGLLQANRDQKALASDMGLRDWAKVAALGIAALVDVLKVASQAILSVIGSYQAVWADLKLAGTFAFGGQGLNPFSEENRRILDTALAERERVVRESNERYVHLWNMNGSAVYDAVKKSLEQIDAAVATPRTALQGGGFSFDFSAGKEQKDSEFDKLKKQLSEQLATTGELTRAQEVLNLLTLERYKEVTPQQRAELLRIAAKIDYTKQLTEYEKELAAFEQKKPEESEFDKLKKQLQEQIAKTGDLTRAQEVLNLLELDRYKEVTPQQRAELLRLAAKIDYTKQLTEDEQELAAFEAEATKQRTEQQTRELGIIRDMRSDRQTEIELLKLQSREVDLFSREYEKLVAAKRHEIAVNEAVVGMLPETAARYREVADELFKARQAIDDLNYAQSRTFDAGAKRALKSYIEEISDVSKQAETLFSNAFRGMEDALVQFVMTGKFNFKELVTSILADMARLFARRAIMQVFTAAFGQGAGTPMPSFEGGGYTGNGGRSGGVDGRGGFMAVLHPNETVVDHSKNNGNAAMSNSVVVNVNVESNSEQVSTKEGAGELGRVISSAVKQELINQKRPGGLLAA